MPPPSGTPPDGGAGGEEGAGASEIRPAFGNRYLSAAKNVFAHNAWDDVEVTAEEEERARGMVERQQQHPVSPEEQGEATGTPLLAVMGASSVPSVNGWR